MDNFYMKQAIKIANTSTYDVPVGAVVVYKDKVIGQGYNMRESLKDPTAHAEMIAIKEASQYLGGWRLVDCTLYVTLEPCAMCAGAIVNARVPRLVIGTEDPRFGCCGSAMDITNHPKLNHSLEVSFGIMEEECRGLLQDFFKDLRKGKKKR